MRAITFPELTTGSPVSPDPFPENVEALIVVAFKLVEDTTQTVVTPVRLTFTCAVIVLPEGTMSP